MNGNMSMVESMMLPFGAVNPAAAKSKKPAKPRTDYKNQLAVCEQQLRASTRDSLRWRRRAMLAESRYESLRGEQIHLLMQQVAGSNWSASTAEWLERLLTAHMKQLEGSVGSQVGTRSGQVRSEADLTAAAAARPSAAGETREKLDADVAAALKEQSRVLQEAWYHDLKPVLRSFEDADRLLESAQLLLSAWRADVGATQRLAPLLKLDAERDRVLALVQACATPIVILEAEVKFLEQQH